MNILWITCDEMQARALSVYGNALLRGRLPGIERLAAEGCLFERAFCQMPKCVPMRGMLQTGRYVHCDGLRTMSRGPFAAGEYFLLDRHAPSLVADLGAAGYRLGLAGRQHIYHPAEAEAVGLRVLNRGDDRPLRYQSTPDPVLKRAYYDGRVADDYDGDRDFYDGRSVTAMIDFMADDDGRPFYGMVDIGHPHPPYCTWPGFVDDIPDEDIPLPPELALEEASICDRAWREAHDVEALTHAQKIQLQRAYLSQCCYADRQLGRLLDALDAQGIADETLVILCADHGDYMGAHGCYEKWDTALYDPIVQVPLLMRLPGRIPAGQRRAQLVETIDVCPSIYALLGQAQPQHVQGESLLPIIDDASAAHKSHVFAQGGVEAAACRRPGLDYEQRLRPCYFGKQRTLIEYPAALERSEMVRGERWKLIRRMGGSHELYDLEADPHELENRYGAPELAAEQHRLEQALLDFHLYFQADQPPIRELWA